MVIIIGVQTKEQIFLGYRCGEIIQYTAFVAVNCYVKVHHDDAIGSITKHLIMIITIGVQTSKNGRFYLQ
jgi:hypothetical protein